MVSSDKMGQEGIFYHCYHDTPDSVFASIALRGIIWKL